MTSQLKHLPCRPDVSSMGPVHIVLHLVSAAWDPQNHNREWGPPTSTVESCVNTGTQTTPSPEECDTQTLSKHGIQNSVVPEHGSSTIQFRGDQVIATAKGKVCVLLWKGWGKCGERAPYPQINYSPAQISVTLKDPGPSNFSV